MYCLHSFVGVIAEAFLPVSVDKNKGKESIAILSGDSHFQDLLRGRHRFTIGIILGFYPQTQMVEPFGTA